MYGVLLGLLLSSLVAGFALRRGSLSRSGAWAALAIGTSIFAGGGFAWFCALLTFFVTSTLLSKVGRARKERIKLDFEKGDTRDARQAFSNGGVAALIALVAIVNGRTLELGAAFIGALATAAGDTWATELGTLSKREPFSLTRFRRVPRGTSGAVSPLGMLATALGGGAIGLSAALVHPFDMPFPSWAVIAGVVAGVVGSLVDSLLGATLQASYRCELCRVETEAKLHHCGNTTVHTRGLLGFDNDVVNLVATACGALVGWSVPHLAVMARDHLALLS